VVGSEESRGAMDALQKAGRARASGVPRYLEGEALLLSRQTADAKRAFESSLQADIFNPLAYRAQFRLAEIVRLSSATEAEPLLRKSLEQSPRYLPARSLLGRVLAAQQKWGEAKTELAAVAEAGASRWEDEMALGTVLANLSELEAAKSAFLRAREKGAPAALLLDATRAASPALAEEIGLDAPRERPSPKKKRGR
jgi:predicted negative regulator of RcsB-dependent stress response